MEEEKTPELDPIQVNPYSVEKISESALCMICFKPFCDIICKGPCSRTFHSCCIRLQGGKSKSWKCPMCASKEVEKFSKSLRIAREECNERHELTGCGFGQLIQLDTVVSHKKRDIFSSKTVKCSECDKRSRNQLLRCIICGSLFHRGCLSINCIPISSRFVICPSHYQNSGSDYLHSSLQEQFDKLKGTIVPSGRGSHLLRGRGRGRSRGAVGGNRGGRGSKRLNHLIISDPTLCNTKAETIVCERCGKVHRYPSYIDKKYFPKHWFCEYDVWNKKQVSCDIEGNKPSQEENSPPRVKTITPAIWGGESIKTNNKVSPSQLNSVGLINYLYFSKIAQKATNRINYLGFVSSSYAFNHNVDSNNEMNQLLAENTPISKLSQSILQYYQTSSSLSIKEIVNDSTFFSSIFGNQKSLVVKCVRALLEKNLIVLLDEGTSLTDESVFVFNDRPNVKGEDIKTIRLRNDLRSGFCVCLMISFLGRTLCSNTYQYH